MTSLDSAEQIPQKSCDWFREHRDLQATAMSVNWSGEWVLLAGRRHLALQNLIHPEEEIKKFHRNSKYEVSSAEFAICHQSQEYCAIATSQLIEVVTWHPDPTLMSSLRAHTRVVTDIDWHSKIPHLLASCSIDTFTHLWDLREPRKPILSLSAVCMSGATQVGFNRVSGNLIATAHDGDLRIWDIRKGSRPIQYITAHLTRIHGINWSHENETHLVTASQDGSVKYFDITNPRRAESIITSHCPVWRARYTPFSDGLITIIVPVFGRGESCDNNLQLWNNSRNKKGQSAPLCSFVGHNDVVLDFAWRPNRNIEANSDRELLTWSRDQTFRVWKVDEKLQKMCGKITEEFDDSLVLDGFHDQKASNKYSTDKSLCALQHEFSLLNSNIPGIREFEILDPIKRNAIIRIVDNGYVIILQVFFPVNYPNGVAPDFEYCQGTSIDESLSLKLMKILKDAAISKVKKGKTCLEHCLRELVSELKRESDGDKGHLRLQSPRLEGALSGVLDACIPFPKTSGVRFNGSGLLVAFSTTINNRITLRHQATTPRALSALSGGYLGNVMGSKPVLYAPRDHATLDRKSARSRNSSKLALTSVTVYDVSKLLLISKELAANYVINTNNIPEMCRYNKKVVEDLGTRPDLVQCWSLAEMIANSMAEFEYDDDIFCSPNPFVKNLLDSLINHYSKISDVQTAAMLTCTFGKYCKASGNKSRTSSISSKSNTSPNVSPYHTILPVDTTQSSLKYSAFHLAQQLKQMRSNSWSDSLDEFRSSLNEINRSLLSETQRNLHDSFKKAYAEILYSWGLLTQRAHVLKFLSTPPPNTGGVEFVTECKKCKRSTRGPSCTNCKKPLLYCTLCRFPVKGSAICCLLCSHGGHTEHLKRWFDKNDDCAYGCGCKCVLQSILQIDMQ